MKYNNIKRTNLLQTAALLERAAENGNTKWRQLFHIMPKTGWLNDPNGLCRFNGEYHIFFQYSPFDTKPGTNFWGHYKTKDFISYEYLSPALCCDQNFDCHGVYSGSTLIDEGKMYLYYTGNVKQLGDFDYITKGREHNLILAVSEDGLTFNDKALLMKNSDYPSDCTCHVRDPKVFKCKGKYYMVLGSRTTADTGEVLVYVSDNKTDWKLVNRLRTAEKFGYMWECPDLFFLDGKEILAFSPQGIEPEGFKYNNVYQSGYALLQGGFTSPNCSVGEFEELDRGFDFYAPQSFEAEDGRRIMIGWLGLPDLESYYENPSNKFGWAHCLTIPRELSLRGNKLMQKPLKEYEKLREKELSVENQESVRALEALISYNSPVKAEISIHGDCKIIYENSVLTLSFGKSGYGRKSRSVRLQSLEEIRIFCDSSSVEIFVNGGEEVFTSRFYPENYSGIKPRENYEALKIWQLKGFEYI